MNDRLARVRAVFIEPPVARDPAPAAASPSLPAAESLTATVGAGVASADLAPWAIAGATRSLAPAAPGGRGAAPTVVVLCTAPRSRVAAATFALALARALGASCGIAASSGTADALSSPIFVTRGARRAAARLRGRGENATACGRLVWLPDRRAAASEELVARDPAAAAAAASADLGRAVAATGAPGVLAVPLARSAALDRVIAWHNGVVVMCEPDVMPAVVERALGSIGSLGLPVVGVSPPARHAAAVAQAGLRAPAAAMQAILRLGLGIAGS